jgi:hypothetical protein
MHRFEDLLVALQTAVAEAQGQLEKQHLTLLENFFIKRDDVWEARMVSIVVPPSTQPIQVPLLSLIPLSSLRIKDLTFDFTVDLARLEKDLCGTRGLLVDLQPPPATNAARISISLSGGDPPEGLMRLNDRIVRAIP